MRHGIAFLVLSLLAQSFCAGGVTWEKIGDYDIGRLEKILTTEAVKFNADPPAYTKPRTSVVLYRVTYSSVVPDQGNRRIIATGLVAIPDAPRRGNVPNDRTLPMVSYQHGTVFGKQDVPSFPENSYEARLMIAQFAGQGYVVIAPDYFGMGDSKENEGYIVVRNHQQACMDFLDAAKPLLQAEKITPSGLFLCGWSQGGFATQAFLQRLERERIPVRAAATAAAPSDPFAFISGFLNFRRDLDASWTNILFIYLPFSYENYFNMPGLAESFLTPEAYDLARRIYLRDPSVTSKDIPEDITSLVRREYFDPVYFAESAFGRQLRKIQPYRWVFRTPLKMYYTDADEAVRPAQAQLAANFAQAVGNDKVEAILVGEKLNHRGAFAHAVPEWKKWFDSLSADAQPRTR